MEDKTTAPRKGGRPSKEQAEGIRDRILDIATDLFLNHGYGSTSIEQIAFEAGMSKRTLYQRFANKSELFGAVVHRLMEQLRPPQADMLFEGEHLETVLHHLAEVMVQAALTSPALAMQRLIMAEAGRFPELVEIMDSQGMRKEAITRISALLVSKTNITLKEAHFAAEQFLQMVISVPQRYAMLGTPMDAKALQQWTQNTVTLFLHGCRMVSL